MRIGLTYDLKSEYLARGWSAEDAAEFDREETIDALASALAAHGHTPDRVGGAEALVQRLAAGDRWDLVFNLAEGARGLARESQVPSILDVFGIPYTFSDPLVLAVALHKGLAKHVARAAGVPTADFAVVERAPDLAAVDLPFPLFVKPVAEGTSKGVTPESIVRDRAALERVVPALLARHHQPVIVETYLPGREFTVGLIGTGETSEVLGSMEVVLLEGAEQGLYSYRNKHDWVGKVTYRFGASDDEARQAEAVALAAWRALGCRDAGRVDVRSDAAGRPSFIEVNPLAGLQPGHSDLCVLAERAGVDHRALVGRILDAARARL